MVCRFILGRAGSGKSYYCLHKLAEKIRSRDFEQKAILIVPEQATFVYEMRLVKEFALPGFTHVEITSFNRLIYRSRKEYPKEVLPSLSPSGKLMALTQILAQATDQLKYFKKEAFNSGFIQGLIILLEEFKTYNISPGYLKEIRSLVGFEESQAKLLDKLSDLALFHDAFSEFCRDKYTDAVDGLQELGDAIEHMGFLTGSQVYIDGFSSFTPSEEYVIQALFKRAYSVEIALAMDPVLTKARPGEEDLYYSLWRTYRRLHDLAEDLTEIKAPHILGIGEGRFKNSPELSFIEQNLFPITQSSQWLDEPSQIRIIRALDPTLELQNAGREILRLVREEGYRYRDISIIARCAKDYEEEFKRIFGDLGIPFFLDSKKPLAYHPLVDLVRSLWETANQGWHYNFIFRYLKNPLSPLEAWECDKLENYCLAAGMRFYHWDSLHPWSFWPRTLSEPEREGQGLEDFLREIDALRHKAVGVLRAFTQEVKAARTVQDYCQALKAALEALEVGKRLQGWAEVSLLAGDGQNASIHSQAWQGLLELLLEAESFMGGLSMEAEDFAKILGAGLEGLEISLIPPGIDQVFVASIDRSRNPEVKATFIIGVNSGEMPLTVKGEGLLTTAERDILSNAGLELSPDNNSRQLAENFLIYIACTRPSAKLYLSYSLNDHGGGSRTASSLIKRIKELFPHLKEEWRWREKIPSDLAGGRDSLTQLSLVLDDLSKGLPVGEFWQDVYNWYLDKLEYAPVFDQIVAGLVFEPPFGPLDKALIPRLYGEKLRSSVSRLEKFRSCPFAYFAAYGLKLKPRRVYRLTPMDRGQLFHEVLADIGRRVNQEGAWQALDEQAIEKLVDDSLNSRLSRFMGNILSSSSRYAYLAKRLRNTLVNTLRLWVEHLQKGDFEPIAFELSFGGNGELPALVIPLGENKQLEIFGVIDRVDAATSDDTTWFRVVDYKTGKETLDIEDMFKGLRLQLLVYLQVVMGNASLFCEGKQAPAGIYYSWVRDDMVSVSMPDPDAEEPSKTGLRLEGLTVKDPKGVYLADKGLKSGYSQLIPVAIKKDGDFYANSPGITPAELHELRLNLYRLLQETAGGILDGVIQARPRSKKGFNVCEYCEYQVVCGLEGELNRENPNQEEELGREEASHE